MTIEEAPIGTRAPAYIGGYWEKTVAGWKWCTGSTFPRPGGDWTGELIPPDRLLEPETHCPYCVGRGIKELGGCPGCRRG